MTIKQVFICLLLIALVASKKEIWIRYETHQQEAEVLQKYFHRNQYGYFVDLGGFNPIEYSNTVRFSSWNGVVVEASERRLANIRLFQPHIASLNFAMTNVSGKMVTLYEAESKQASSLSHKVVQDIPYQQQKTIGINMADLCHKYYKVRPNLLNIDIQGTEQMVLRSNDWANEKCVPDVIFAEDDEVNRKAGQVDLEQILLDNNYTRIERVKPSTLYIHKSKLEFYKKEAEANADYIKNKVVYSWSQVAESFTKMLGKKFQKEFDCRTNPAFPFLQQPEIISILDINKHSNYISRVGPNRPIIILEYDEKISSIYLGTKKFNIQTINVNKFNYKKITADYNKKTLTIYVFNHQKYNQFNLRFAQEKENQLYMAIEFQDMINNLKESFFIAIVVMIIPLIAYLWKKSFFTCKIPKISATLEHRSA